MKTLDDLVADGAISAGVKIGDFTTYKLGGPADYFADVANESSLHRVLDAWRPTGLPLLILGWGSNLVVADRGFRGLVVRPVGEFAEIEHRESDILAGCAARLPVLARSAVNHGRLGLEFFVGIPGTVGGAVRQNAGCHGSDTSEWLRWADVCDASTGRTTRHTGSELEMAYRRSNIEATHMVTRASFRFEGGQREVGERRLREITRWRREHQPGGTLNAGSVFKNPPGDAAGRLIDSVGLKGFRVGAVAVSERHANFFVADREATAADLRALIRTVRDRVKQETGVDLEPEIRLIGDFDGD
jgi:UDP-N-acetylmuramate dehydrogenase